MNPSEMLEAESTPSGLRRQERARPALLDSAASASWKFLAVAAAGAVVLFALVQLRVVVFPVIAAIFLSTLIHPVVTLLQQRGLPRLPSVALAMAGALGLLAGLVALLAPQVANEFGTLSEDVRSGSRQVIQWLSRGPLELTRTELDRYFDRALSQLETNSSTITSGVLAGAIKLGEVVVGIILSLVLTFFFVKDGAAMFSWLTSHFEERRQRSLNLLGERLWETLGAYLRGLAIVGMVDAVLIGIALMLIGVPLVIPLAVLTFFGAFLPLIGATVAGVVAALVALVSGGVVDALLVGAAILVIQQVEGHVLQPVVLGRAIKLHPVVVLLSLAAGGVLGGIAGAFLAVPIAALATVVGSHIKAERDAYSGAG
ncbi:MAG TPA: AI-2E family transporter [Actinomycetota bacterium]|nr:AI-2E family transporter [Actinomycetota bacterium]